MPRSVALYVLLVCACAVTAVLAADKLRITPFYDDLTAPAATQGHATATEGEGAGDATTAYCTKVDDKVVDRQNGATVTCTADDVMSAVKISDLMKAVVAAIAMHASYLSVVTPSATTGIKFPTSDARCTHFSISAAQKAATVTGADFALFVAASPMSPDMQAWGTWCGPTTTPTTRPEVGAVNIVPKHFPAYGTALTRLVAREILVGLGFGLYAADGYKDVTKTTVRGKTGVPAAKGTKVLAAAKKHFGCNSMAGVELEYADEASKTPLPYWRGRVMKDDLMALNQTAGYYTAITIAAMVDTGFYTADTTATAEDMPWGRDAGCDFISKKCINDGTAIGGMFCTGDTTSLSCTSDRLALGTCGTQTYTDNLPAYFQYFKDKKVGGMLYSMDYCPVVAPTNMVTHCSTTNSDMPHSVFGGISRCLNLQSATVPYANMQMHGLCADIHCNAADSTYKVQVKGATAAVSCSADKTVDVDISTDKKKKTGKLQCPAYADVCALPAVTPTTGTTTTTKKPPSPHSSSSSKESSSKHHGDSALTTGRGVLGSVIVCVAVALIAVL